jgi:uncharacterized protein HemY
VSERVEAFARQHPQEPEALLLAGRVAYLGKRWGEAAEYFRRAPRPSSDRAELLFYMAVAFYESGDLLAAQETLELALPRLEKTPFVRGYVERILPPTPPAGSD